MQFDILIHFFLHMYIFLSRFPSLKQIADSGLLRPHHNFAARQKAEGTYLFKGRGKEGSVESELGNT